MAVSFWNFLFLCHEERVCMRYTVYTYYFLPFWGEPINQLWVSARGGLSSLYVVICATMASIPLLLCHCNLGGFAENHSHRHFIKHYPVACRRRRKPSKNKLDFHSLHFQSVSDDWGFAWLQPYISPRKLGPSSCRVRDTDLSQMFPKQHKDSNHWTLNV